MYCTCYILEESTQALRKSLKESQFQFGHGRQFKQEVDEGQMVLLAVFVSIESNVSKMVEKESFLSNV